MVEFEIYNGSDTERYVLGTKGNNPLIVIGINPSIANEETSDNTISRVMGYAQRFGYDSFIMVNIYPLRATNFNKLPQEFNKQVHKQNLMEINNKKRICDFMCLGNSYLRQRVF